MALIQSYLNLGGEVVYSIYVCSRVEYIIYI